MTTLRTVGTPVAKFRAEFEAAFGTCYGRTIVAPLGGNWSAEAIRKQLADCRSKQQIAFLWCHASKADYMGGLKFESLPDQPAAKELPDLLAEHAAPTVVCLLDELGQYASDKLAGYALKGADYTAVFDAIAVTLPANAYAECSLEPGAAVGKIQSWQLPEWFPTRAVLGGLHYFGDSVVPNTSKYDLAKVWADITHDKGLVVGVSDSGFTGPGDVTDPTIFKPWANKLLKVVALVGAEYLCLSNSDWGNLPSQQSGAWVSGRFTASLDGTWPGCPEGVAMLVTKFQKGAVMLAPAPIVALPAPGGGFPVQPAEET